MTNPKLAVFIPCYNASATILETLNSVREAVIKTATKIPIYIYDDFSTDNSAKIVEMACKDAEDCVLIRNSKNLGERKTTNAAFNSFRNRFDWVFLIHADDVVKDDWIVSMLPYIKSDNAEKYFTVWSSYDCLTENTGQIVKGDNTNNVSLLVRNHGEIKYLLTNIYSSWHISGAALNVAFYHKLNGFDETLAQFGDTDFFVRGLLEGFLDVYISRTLTIYRVSDGSVSSVSLRTGRDIREIFYLIKKFHQILSKNDVRSMSRIVGKLSARRMLKSLKGGKFESAWINFKQLGKSCLKSV